MFCIVWKRKTEVLRCVPRTAFVVKMFFCRFSNLTIVYSSQIIKFLYENNYEYKSGNTEALQMINRGEKSQLLSSFVSEFSRVMTFPRQAVGC